MFCLHVTSLLLFGPFFIHLLTGSGDRLEVKEEKEVTWHFRGDLPRVRNSLGSWPATIQGKGGFFCYEGHQV